MTQDWKKALLLSMIFIILFHKCIFYLFDNPFLFYCVLIVVVLIFSYLYWKFIYFINNISCFVKDILIIFLVSLFISIVFFITYFKTYYIMSLFFNNYDFVYTVLCLWLLIFIIRIFFLFLLLPEWKNE